jgi:hypothetical protein
LSVMLGGVTGGEGGNGRSYIPFVVRGQ